MFSLSHNTLDPEALKAQTTDPRSGGFVCFEGRGAGEVLVGEKKLVGISQRRTRAGSRFQCVWYRRWQLGALQGLVDRDAVDDLAQVGVGTDDLGLSATSGDVLATVVRAIRGSNT